MTRVIIVGSSVFLAVLGAMCLFLPETTTAALAFPHGTGDILSVVACGQLGLAAMNWMRKCSTT